MIDARKAERSQERGKTRSAGGLHGHHDAVGAVDREGDRVEAADVILVHWRLRR